jgi:hypothetical protein
VSGSAVASENFYLYASSYSLPFAPRSSALTNGAKTILTDLSMIIVPHGLTVITGYAFHNAALAKKRATAVAKYLSSKVAIGAQLKTHTGTAANKTTLFLDGGTIDTAPK